MKQTRRQFIEHSATALAAAAIVPGILSSCSSNSGGETAPVAATPASDGKPNSNFGGVQIGAISYSWRSMDGGLENIIKYCKETNINSIELMSNDLEKYLGAPESPMMGFMREAMAKREAEAKKAGAPAGAGAPPRQRPSFTPEQQAAIDKYNEDAKAWRLSLDMNKVEQARQLMADSGLDAHIVKFSPSKWSDEEIDYAFKVAKAMGAKAVTDELSQEAAERLAPFAEKHDMIIAFHNHMQYAQEGFSCDPMLALSPKVMLNFDAGHYFGSTGKDPVEFINKYHERIYSIHIKDKTGPNTQPTPNANQVWGQGEMPLEAVLNCLKDKKYPIYADIELEYEVAPWSNQVREVATCVKYARQILM